MHTLSIDHPTPLYRIGAGLVALLLGVVIYFARAANLDIMHGDPLPNLPSFLHAFAFVVLLSAFDARKTAFLSSVVLCLAVEVAFEYAQKRSDWFYVGTFDVMDIVFAVAGALCGFLLLIATNAQRSSR